MANRSRRRYRSKPGLPPPPGEHSQEEEKRLPVPQVKAGTFCLALLNEEVRNQCMRFSSPFLLALSLSAVVAQEAIAGNWMESYDRLLKKYVTPAGVKYAAWKANTSDLQEVQKVVEEIGAANVSSMNKSDQLAFYINAYNAWILHEALGKYPTKSVKDVLFTFFTSKRIKVAGQQMSFNALEKDTIRSKFGEPRVHFALNCASRSCPPLNRTAFSADKL